MKSPMLRAWSLHLLVIPIACLLAGVVWLGGHDADAARQAGYRMVAFLGISQVIYMGPALWWFQRIHARPMIRAVFLVMVLTFLLDAGFIVVGSYFFGD